MVRYAHPTFNLIQNDDAFHCATTSFGALGIIFSLVLEVCKYI